MSNSLRIGIAGLGTVGTSLVRLVQDKQDMLAERCGRAIEVTGVTARSKGKDRGISLDAMTWHDDPVSLAISDEIDALLQLLPRRDSPLGRW